MQEQPIRHSKILMLLQWYDRAAGITAAILCKTTHKPSAIHILL